MTTRGFLRSEYTQSTRKASLDPRPSDVCILMVLDNHMG